VIQRLEQIHSRAQKRIVVAVPDSKPLHQASDRLGIGLLVPALLEIQIVNDPADLQNGRIAFTIALRAATAVAAALDRRGIAVRAGDMAALPLLQRFGVSEAVRASAYVYSTTRDLDRLADALHQIVRT